MTPIVIFFICERLLLLSDHYDAYKKYCTSLYKMAVSHLSLSLFAICSLYVLVLYSFVFNVEQIIKRGLC